MTFWSYETAATNCSGRRLKGEGGCCGFPARRRSLRENCASRSAHFEYRRAASPLAPGVWASSRARYFVREVREPPEAAFPRASGRSGAPASLVAVLLSVPVAATRSLLWARSQVIRRPYRPNGPPRSESGTSNDSGRSAARCCQANFAAERCYSPTACRQLANQIAGSQSAARRCNTSSHPVPSGATASGEQRFFLHGK